jgi:long-chain acyl-CoA synthetase
VDKPICRYQWRTTPEDFGCRRSCRTPDHLRTTGRPKFVIHTLATLLKIAESYEHLDLDGYQVSALAMPMVHASGLFTMLAFVRFGVPFVLCERFDPDALLDAIERHRCTWLAGLPFMFTALLQRQRAHPRNVGSLRTCLSAGDVCPAQAQEQFPSVFGVPLRSFWAATEALGSLTYGLESGPVTGIVKGAQVRLVGDDKMPVSPGQVGELIVRGPHVTIGYWAGPGLIEGAPEGGWFHTGDLMRQDEKGILWFVSREKHLIIRGASNIAPVEVERVLMSHPAVRDAAVIGVPDPELGERVAGFVQLADGAQSADPNEILAQRHWPAGRLQSSRESPDPSSNSSERDRSDRSPTIVKDSNRLFNYRLRLLVRDKYVNQPALPADSGA